MLDPQKPVDDKVDKPSFAFSSSIFLLDDNYLGRATITTFSQFMPDRETKSNFRSEPQTYARCMFSRRSVDSRHRASHKTTLVSLVANHSSNAQWSSDDSIRVVNSETCPTIAAQKTQVFRSDVRPSRQSTPYKFAVAHR